jgi:uncharacterized SAM-binding protein YcdF (DUF218 family)
MFGKKYTFESRSTRLRRLFTGFATILVIVVAVSISFVVYVPIYAKMQKGRAAGAFFQKSPDAIAVFTGDKGRIAYALDLLKKNPSAKLFISGVHAANSFQTLVDKQAPPAIGEGVNSPAMQVDLDYVSQNTFENVRETVKFLNKNPEIKQVLIISSDYHIMRINLIISHFMHDSHIQFFFDGVINDYTTGKEIRKLAIESIKIVRTYVQLKVLREEIVEED